MGLTKPVVFFLADLIADDRAALKISDAMCCAARAWVEADEMQWESGVEVRSFAGSTRPINSLHQPDIHGPYLYVRYGGTIIVYKAPSSALHSSPSIFLLFSIAPRKHCRYGGEERSLIGRGS